MSNNKFNIFPFVLLPIIIIFMIKYSNFNNLKYNQTCKKRWARQIFDYFRNDTEMIEKFDGNKFLFYKKKKKKGNKIKKLCGIEDYSKININTDFKSLQEYCNDKKKFLYVVDPNYTPITIFIDSYTEKEKELNFKKYVFNKKIEGKEIDLDKEEENIKYNIDTISNIDKTLILDKKEIEDNNQYFPIFNSNIQDEIVTVKEKSIISNKNINTGGRFVKKPLVGSQGDGIQIIDNFYDCFINKGEIDISDEYIFQEEIIPKLIKGYKFDIRYFAVMVVTKNSIEIKHTPNAMIRLCSKKFSLEKNDLHANLTNTSLNKDIACTLSVSKNEENWGNYFIEMEKITDNFFENVIKEIGEDILYNTNGNSVASTRIFGFDFIISDDDKVYILEGNYCPGDNTEYGKECKKEVIKFYSEVIKKLI